MKLNKLVLAENFFNEPETEWVKKDSKSVADSDGFNTDYTWYTNGEKHIFMFGDADIEEPDESYADWEVEIYPGKEEQAEKQAREWFDGYTSFDDEDFLKKEDSDFAARKILEMVQDMFENGQPPYQESEYKQFVDACSEEGFKGSKDLFNFYIGLVELGPAGFYDEYKYELDFDDDFASEYGNDSAYEMNDVEREVYKKFYFSLFNSKIGDKIKDTKTNEVGDVIKNYIAGNTGIVKVKFPNNRIVKFSDLDDDKLKSGRYSMNEGDEDLDESLKENGTDAVTISAYGLEKGWYISSDVRAPDKLNAKIVTKRTYQSKGKKRITGTTVLPDGSTGYYDYGYTQQVKFSLNLQESAQTQDTSTVEYVIKTDYFGDEYEYLGNVGRSWVTKDSSKIDKFSSRGVAEKEAKEQSRKYKAYVVPTSEIKEEHKLTEANDKAFNPITLKKYGFTRDPENDFADDGNRFTAYLYKGVIPITYLKSHGEVYLSIRLDYLQGINYSEYKEFSSYRDIDKYNGVDMYSVDPQDVANICEKAKQEYEEFLKNVKAPDIKEFEAYRKRYADAYRGIAQKAKQLIIDKIDSIATLDKYYIYKIFDYYNSILNYVDRYTKPYTGSESYMRDSLTPKNLETQKREIDDIENFFYFKQIKELLSKTK